MSLSHYTDTDEPAHERAKRTIARVLANDHRGRYREENGEQVDNTISSADLAERTPVGASTVRDLIKEVRREYRLPIGNANGYFVIETREEFVRQVQRQERQAETSLETARDMAAAWNRNGGEVGR